MKKLLALCLIAALALTASCSATGGGEPVPPSPVSHFAATPSSSPDAAGPIPRFSDVRVLSFPPKGR
jgi:hypothetical protein